MTCKDCNHSGLCYMENDYDNFPDRCGRFISDEDIVKRPHGKTNAEIFKQTFGIYATEVWSMEEADFLKWINDEYVG